ncbi:MAG TPA: helix-turn-helix transcriptional regulator [Streptosporangiaceae bacterium]
MVDEWRDDEPVDELIARVRIAQGKSQQSLADDVARVSGDTRITREYVSRWENAKRIPTPYWREHVGEVLGVPRDVLDRAAAVARTRRVAAQIQTAAPMAPIMATVLSDEASRTLEETLDYWDELMRRRNFLGGAGAIAATSVLAGGMPAAAAALPPVSDRPEVFATCARLIATYRQMDMLLGPSAVYAQVADHHRRLSAWLAQARAEADRRRLGELVTDSGDLLGWLCVDLDRRDQAAVLYRQAAQAAAEIEDVNRQAYMVGRMSSTLYNSGRHDQMKYALALAEAAEGIAGTAATPIVRSWLAMTRAEAHAGQADESACRASLERAAKLLDRAKDEPRDDYVAFWGDVYMRRSIGRTLLKLGEKKASAVGEGSRAIEEAMAMWPEAAVRDSASVLTSAASARLAQGDITETSRLTGRAFEIASRTGSSRLLRDITKLRTRMRPYRHTRAVRELDEKLLTSR